MHQYSFQHRDIKLENILFKKGAIKLTDFGTAKDGNLKTKT